MKVINIGSSAYTNYLVDYGNSYILIDCGNKIEYSKFRKTLEKHSIELNSIKYVLLTHAHSDHLSYFNELLEDINPTIICSEEFEKKYLVGHDQFYKYTSPVKKSLTKFVSKLRGGPTRWETIDLKVHQKIEVKFKESVYIDELKAEAISLPGHTSDSIGIFFDNKMSFLGDMFMNIILTPNKLPILIENLSDYKDSYNVIKNKDSQQIYLGHGKSIGSREIIKLERTIAKMKAY